MRVSAGDRARTYHGGQAVEQMSSVVPVASFV
jgi:hypothetical protein